MELGGLRKVAVMTNDPRNGPGLRVVGTETWYGPGYCGICGETGNALVPRAVRWWDCDDGWRMGVLCVYCMEDARVRGPRPGDYAMVGNELTDRAAQIDVGVLYGDEDSTYSDLM